jgi:hypothetical protein
LEVNGKMMCFNLEFITGSREHSNPTTTIRWRYHQWGLVVFTKYNCNDEVKEDDMGRAYNTNVEKRNGYRILVGIPEEKRPLGRRKLLWVDNIKMKLREIGCNVVDWIDLAQDRDQCGPL